MKKDLPFIDACVINYVTSVVNNEKKAFLTSLEIQDALSDIAEFELNDIALAMHNNGFKLGCREDGAPAWIILEPLNF